MSFSVALAGLAFLVALMLTGLMRVFAVRAGLMDRPNERSSHTIPTPRGGGVGIVAAFLLVMAASAWISLISWRLVGAVGAGGLLIAALGFIDDRRGLPARIRFAGHSVAAIWILYWVGDLPALPLLGMNVPLGLAGPLLAFLFITWMVNLFNFMDGIDGLAGLEALTVGASGTLLWYLFGDSSHEWLAGVLFSASLTGFLLWNFPPAKIFMGDAGSGFIGFVIAALALWSCRTAPVLVWSWAILSGCFIVDATTTLIRRVRRGERFHEAHRSHAYQYASRRFGAHRPVTIAVGMINFLWLFPVAALVAGGWLDGLLGIILAYAPLIWLAFHFRAGDKKMQECHT